MSDTHISITEVTVLSGRKKAFKLEVEGRMVSIPVDEKLFAHYKDQLWREHPSRKQKDVFATVMNLMQAAYLQGCEDGKKG
jgi:hypothetical protein